MFKKLSESLKEKFSRKNELSKHIEIVRVFDLYRNQVREANPRLVALPVKLRNKVLTVQTASSAQANELRYSEKNILEAVNQALGREVIRRVVYRF